MNTGNINNLMTDNLLPQMKNNPLGKAGLLSGQDKAKAEKTAEDFEAFFISRMMESMFEGVSTDGLFGGGHAEKIYRSLLLDEYGKVMAKTGSIGVKDEVMRSILEIQEQQSQSEAMEG